MRTRIALVLASLFVLSVLIRHPLFNHEFTHSHEWLSAHTLITVELWNEVPAAIHHFDLIFTFPSAADKFVNDLWTAGVPDRLGNYYYVSMPPLGFLTPYLFCKILQLRPGIAALQSCALFLHFAACVLLYILMRRLSAGRPGSVLASGAAFCVLLFAPTALFYYQNAMVGTVVVIPYTLLTLIAAAILLQSDASTRMRQIAFLLLLLSLLGGCLADWQGFFTAFATAVVGLAAAIRVPGRRRDGILVLLTACAGVALAIAIITVQDSRIAGFSLFAHTILGRFRVRTSGNNINLWSFDYYRRLARSYAAFLQFLVCAAIFFGVAARRGYRGVPDLFRRSAVPLAISLLAVFTDHAVLANHTAIHIFTTLNTLVPIAIVCGLGALAYYESAPNLRRAGTLICGAMLLCAAISVGEYYAVYRNRPHPFLRSASLILAAAAPGDVIFAAGEGFRSENDTVVPQLLYYLQRNVEVVDSPSTASRYLTAHGFQHGVLAYLNADYIVTGIETINPSSRDIR